MTSHRNCLMTRRSALRVGVGAFGLTLPGLLQAQAAAGRRPAKSPRAKSVIVLNGKGGQGYDSHSVPPSPPHLQWAKDELLPPTDAAFSALIEDLHDRGLLDETLVVMMGEFGRTPTFNKDGGRDHWPGCYSLVLAGGGIAGGLVYGASDSIASTPVRDPVSPNDLMATVYHLLGVDHRAVMYDMQDRPHVILEGDPVQGLLA